MADTRCLDGPFFDDRHRALRIHEGATEVQQLIIARELLREAGRPA